MAADRRGMHLGLDVGGGATRWRLLDDNGALVRSGETLGFSGQFANDAFRRRAEQALADISAGGGAASHVTAGVTGLSRETADAATLARMLREALAADHCTVMSDIELVCHAARDEGADIALYAGTGSIAAHLKADGELLTAGGKGVLIDDAGGGYWITVRALRHVLRAEDSQPGSGWPTLLGQAIGKRIGGADWSAVRSTFYALDRGAIGRLAVAVGEAAAAGDAAALDILKAAGGELAGFARMLLTRTGLSSVALSGGVLKLHPIIEEAVRSNLSDVLVKRLTTDTALIAARLSHAAAKSAG